MLLGCSGVISSWYSSAINAGSRPATIRSKRRARLDHRRLNLSPGAGARSTKNAMTTPPLPAAYAAEWLQQVNQLIAPGVKRP